MVDEFMDSSSPLVQQTYQSWTSTTISEMRELLLSGKATGDFTEKDGAFVFMMIIGAFRIFLQVHCQCDELRSEAKQTTIKVQVKF